MKKSEIIIRPAQEGDLRALVKLLEQLFQIETDFSVDEKKQIQGLQQLLQKSDRWVLVAEYRGQVVGMCTMQRLISTAMGGWVGLIEDVIVEYHYRGQGIGKQLMDHIEAMARQQSLLRVQLLADVTNPGAAKFYSHLGWKGTSLQAFCKHNLLDHAEKKDAV